MRAGLISYLNHITAQRCRLKTHQSLTLRTNISPHKVTNAQVATTAWRDPLPQPHVTLATTNPVMVLRMSPGVSCVQQESSVTLVDFQHQTETAMQVSYCSFFIPELPISFPAQVIIPSFLILWIVFLLSWLEERLCQVLISSNLYLSSFRPCQPLSL